MVFELKMKHRYLDHTQKNQEHFPFRILFVSPHFPVANQISVFKVTVSELTECGFRYERLTGKCEENACQRRNLFDRTEAVENSRSLSVGRRGSDTDRVSALPR